MTYFLKSGANFNVSAKESLDIHELLPVGTYTVKFDQMRGAFYLEMVDDFKIKGKVYGDTHLRAQRILNTFEDRSNSTGVMLSGEKGSGKTLLAKFLSITARDAEIPTIIINQPWAGEEFNTFIQMIEQPAVIIFDEFEKVYSEPKQQEMLLTLLDGVYPSKKLFVITCNDKHRVDRHMENRPGRVYYRFDYQGLDNDFIVEYCEDNLLDQSHIDSVCRVAAMFGAFNFDMLKAMVEEMNRYGESPQQVVQVLNVKPEGENGARYTLALQVNGALIPEKSIDNHIWEGNPLSQVIYIEYYTNEGEDSPDNGGSKKLSILSNSDPVWNRERFEPADLQRFDSKGGEFHFTNSNGARLTLVKAPRKEFNWAAF